MGLNTAELRLASRYVPKGSQCYRFKGTTAVAYSYSNRHTGRPVIVGYSGTSAKPDFHLRFTTDERALDHVTRWVAGFGLAATRKAERAAAKSAFEHSLKVGTILYTSWGYDQTNIDFYEVLKVVGRMVDIREVCTQHEAAGDMTGVCGPITGKHPAQSKVMRKLVLAGNQLRIHSFALANVYERTEVTPGVFIGKPMRFSSYA